MNFVGFLKTGSYGSTSVCVSMATTCAAAPPVGSEAARKSLVVRCKDDSAENSAKELPLDNAASYTILIQHVTVVLPLAACNQQDVHHHEVNPVANLITHAHDCA